MNNVSTPLPDISATSADEEIKQFLPNANVAKTPSGNVSKTTIDLSSVLNASRNSANVGLNVPRSQSGNVGNVGNIGNVARTQSLNVGPTQTPPQSQFGETMGEPMGTGISPMGNVSQQLGNVSQHSNFGKSMEMEELGEPSPAPSQSNMGPMSMSLPHEEKEHFMGEILRLKEKQAELLSRRVEIDSELLEVEKKMAELHEQKTKLMEKKLESHEESEGEHVMAGGGDPYYKKYLKYKSKYINKQRALKLRN